MLCNLVTSESHFAVESDRIASQLTDHVMISISQQHSARDGKLALGSGLGKEKAAPHPSFAFCFSLVPQSSVTFFAL